MTLEEARAHVGETVLYSSVPGECEAGVIVTVGSKYVHVCYGRGQNAKATRPEMLTLMRGGSVAEHFQLNMIDAGFPMAGERAARTCEMDGTREDDNGAEHYWNCGKPGAVPVDGALLCEDHAGERGYGPKQAEYGFDPDDGLNPTPGFFAKED